MPGEVPTSEAPSDPYRFEEPVRIEEGLVVECEGGVHRSAVDRVSSGPQRLKLVMPKLVFPLPNLPGALADQHRLVMHRITVRQIERETCLPHSLARSQRSQIA